MHFLTEGVFHMLKKTYKKWLSSAIVLSLGVTLSYGAVPAKPAEAFNWGNLAGAVFVTTAQQQQLEKQLGARRFTPDEFMIELFGTEVGDDFMDKANKVDEYIYGNK